MKILNLLFMKLKILNAILLWILTMWLTDLTLMLLTAKLANTNLCKDSEKLLKPLANGYSSESAQQELSNEYQRDRVIYGFKKSLHPCALGKSSHSIGRVK